MEIKIERIGGTNPGIRISSGPLLKMVVSEDDAMKLADGLTKVAYSEAKSATITTETVDKGAELVTT